MADSLFAPFDRLPGDSNTLTYYALHPTTEPAAIRKTHRKLVKDAYRAGLKTAAAISEHTVLPVWNVVRAAEALRLPLHKDRKKVSPEAAARDELHRTIKRLLKGGEMSAAAIGAAVGVTPDRLSRVVEDYAGVYEVTFVKTDRVERVIRLRPRQRAAKKPARRGEG